MNAPSTDVMDMLQADADLNLSRGDNLFSGVEPASPNNAVTLYDTGGFAPGIHGYRQPTLQVRVRNVDYQDGWEILENIFQSLQARYGETWGGTYYTAIVAQSDLQFIETDEHDRYIFTLNLRLDRR